MAGAALAASSPGFLVTGGLDHIRQPANGQPLHGRLPFSPARVTAYGEDWEHDVLFCEGEVTQARHGGEALRLTRRIEAPIGGTSLTILDTVENLGLPAVAAGESLSFQSRLSRARRRHGC